MPLPSAHRLPRPRPVRSAHRGAAVAAKIAAIGTLVAVCGAPAQGHASPLPESRPAQSPARCVPRLEQRLVVGYIVWDRIGYRAKACPPILRGQSSLIRNAKLIYR
jgi:hypothetical protein